ncbi:hypothetical protein RRG08_048287 [Elysia crispata]|uniref:Uncharacterized protein n=1 Tax=Elysia crispata TaxID=231223 RepID=A0AAE0ZUX3_9GAST|nr:hypothetical protein RRG08_048287 [Elysia crispata]
MPGDVVCQRLNDTVVLRHGLVLGRQNPWCYSLARLEETFRKHLLNSKWKAKVITFRRDSRERELCYVAVYARSKNTGPQAGGDKNLNQQSVGQNVPTLWNPFTLRILRTPTWQWNSDFRLVWRKAGVVLGSVGHTDVISSAGRQLQIKHSYRRVSKSRPTMSAGFSRTKKRLEIELANPRLHSSERTLM